MLKRYLKLYITPGIFFLRNFPKKLGEMGHDRAFEFTERFGHYFFLDLVYNESLYCLVIPTQ